MPTIVRDGIKLAFEDRSAGKPAFVFVHGTSCNRSFFAPQAEHFARRHRVLTIVVVNNAASGYVKALQHAIFRARYQSSDLVEMDYAAIARAMGCNGIRVEDPERLGEALRTGLGERTRPTVLDVVVTRDPAGMLPAVDNRTVEIKQGDRVA